MTRTEHHVAIVGAGPAGLTLGCLLRLAGGFACSIIERQDRDYIQSRARAGLLEHRTVEMLVKNGLDGRLLSHGSRHRGCEFRVAGEPHQLEFGLLAGETQWVWPQQELVTDLMTAFHDLGGQMHFNASDVFLGDIAGRDPFVTFRTGTERHELPSVVIAGADGFHGISRRAVPPGRLRFVTHHHDFDWVAALASTPPSAPHVVYAVHDNGFAGHMLRSQDITRFYLQCRRDDQIRDWEDDRIWDELRTRLMTVGGSGEPLREGRIIDKSIVPMRSFVTEPMQFKRLFLLGDAAHIVTPVGAKGMNLAIHDAAVLADALASWSRSGSEDELIRYSKTCLKRVWQCQAFSHHLTQLTHRPDPGNSDAEFYGRINTRHLLDMLRSKSARSEFARSYVGV